MTEPTLKSLGLVRIWTGLGPRDFAYAGRGYQIAPGTNRYWRLTKVGAAESVATAHTSGELVAKLAELIEEDDRG